MERNNLDSTNIDSSKFDSQKYLKNMLKSNSVNEIIGKYRELSDNIRTYDQDIQSLVFENYSKFITSIDTIKKMKGNLNNIDSKLNLLTEKFGKIEGAVTKIDYSLNDKHTEIRKLHTINHDLQKLKNICELPSLLSKDLTALRKSGDFSFPNTHNIFEKSFEVLKTSQKEALLAPLYQESIGYIEDIRAILWGLQNNDKTSSDDLRKITKNLAIYCEDSDTVIRNHIKIVKERMLAKVSTFLEELHNSEDSQRRLLPEEIHSFKQGQAQESTKGPMWLINQFEIVLTEELKEEVRYLAETKFQHKLKDFIEELLSPIFQKLANSLNFGKNAAVYALRDCILYKVFGEETNTSLKFEITNLFERNLQKMLENELWNCQCLIFSEALKLRTYKFTGEANDDLKKEVSSQLFSLKNEIYSCLANSLLRVRLGDNQEMTILIIDQFSSMIKTFIQFLPKKMTEMTREFIAQFKGKISMDNLVESKEYFIICNMLLQQFSEGFLAKLEELLIEVLTFGSSFKQVILNYQETFEGDDLPKMLKDCEKGLREGHRNYLISFYIEINSILKEYFKFHEVNPKVSKEFRSISSIIKGALHQIPLFFPDIRRNVIKKNSLLRFASNVDLDTERLMIRKSHLWEKKLDKNSMLNSLFKNLFKSIFEASRRNSFSLETAMQFQINLYYVSQISYEAIASDDESMAIAFFYEIMDIVKKKIDTSERDSLLGEEKLEEEYSAAIK